MDKVEVRGSTPNEGERVKFTEGVTRDEVVTDDAVTGETLTDDAVIVTARDMDTDVVTEERNECVTADADTDDERDTPTEKVSVMLRDLLLLIVREKLRMLGMKRVGH
jgi:hypothetical protein